jgi:CDP-glucose 4,6-dehydratase
MIDRSFWRNKPVFVTGHTGFKGGWLATWLTEMGAHVSGYALPPQTPRSYFTACSLKDRVQSIIGDIRDDASLDRTLRTAKPEVVFHLAAQPLVRRSYREPVATFAANVIGTANLLEAVRGTPSVRAAIVVTSDKCYQNDEWLWGYRETDRLGGGDPYSASKACAEIVCAAYRHSFFENGRRHVSLATVRAGNVIGGGDWSEDRIVPDAIRAFERGVPLVVRNPASVRPWQHVFDALAGYLALAERLCANGAKYSGAWNFGPGDEAAATVSVLADATVRCWGQGAGWRAERSGSAPHEDRWLRLDASKARALLGWRPRLDLEKAVELTVRWYQEAVLRRAGDMYEVSRAQIRCYEQRLEGMSDEIYRNRA